LGNRSNVVEGASISSVIIIAYFLTPRSSVQRIVEEPAWVGHAPIEKLWTFRWTTICAQCLCLRQPRGLTGPSMPCNSCLMLTTLGHTDCIRYLYDGKEPSNA
jgi:hypothetical protein